MKTLARTFLMILAGMAAASRSQGATLELPDLSLNGFAQFDGRYFLEDQSLPAANTFLIRAARLQIEGVLYSKLSFRLAPEFGQGTATLQDAYIDFVWFPGIKTRLGKFKAPLGLERLQATPADSFAELGLSSNLVPNRDLGAELDWTPRKGVLLQAGVFNGSADFASNDGATQDDKDFEGRIFVEPFKLIENPALAGLGLGLAGSSGNKVSAPLPRYVSASQRNLFSYAAGVSLTGQANRVVPQAWFYFRNYGLQAEYARSSVELQKAGFAGSKSVAHEAWQILGGWVLTGEDESYKGVKPASSFDAAARTWGALELVARYGQLKLDEAAFPVFADRKTAASQATAWALGLNEYLNPALRLSLDYEESRFTDGAAQGAVAVDRETEKILFSRVQLNY